MHNVINDVIFCFLPLIIAICKSINPIKMGFISFLSEMIARLLDKGELDEAETSHSKFVSSIVDLLRSGKASSEDVVQALKDLGAVVYIGT